MRDRMTSNEILAIPDSLTNGFDIHVAPFRAFLNYSSALTDNFPNCFRPNWHIHMPNAERRQRIDDSVYDRRRSSDRSRLAHPFYAQRIDRRRRLRSIELEPRNHRRLRQRVVHQRSGDELALFVVNDLLIHRLPERLDDAALHLAVDQHRVDHFPAVIDRNVAQKFYVARFAIDFDYSDVSAKRESEVGRLEEVRSRQSGFRARRNVPGDMRRKRDVLNRDAVAIDV